MTPEQQDAIEHQVDAAGFSGLDWCTCVRDRDGRDVLLIEGMFSAADFRRLADILDGSQKATP